MNASARSSNLQPARSAGAECGWALDAGAALQAALDAPECPPPVVEALRTTVTWQARCDTPLRRLLAAPRLAPQVVAAMLAVGSTVSFAAGDPTTESGLADLLRQGQGAHAAALAMPGAGCFFPLGDMRWGEAHVGRSPADAPIVAAWAVVELAGGVVHQVRVALTGVWEEPARLARAAEGLIGGPLDEARIRAVAAAVQEEVNPAASFTGSAEYRRAMAGLLVRRALLACAAAPEARRE